MFSGIGGFELGIHRAFSEGENTKLSISNIRHSRCPKISKSDESQVSRNHTCIGFSEIDKYAIQIYQKHFKGHKNYGDATRIIPEQLPDFDFLCGGFPCQAFSIAGKRGGFEDTRGTLFFEIARILSVKRPKLLLLENVKGLLSHDRGRTFGTILATLSDLGYFLEWQVLNSKDFGVPQNRERVFIVGHFRGTSRPEVFPVEEDGEVSTKRQGQISSAITSRYYKQGQSDPYVFKESEVSIRKLTPTECERLQGFPDGWTEGISDTQRYKCLGNAVTVNVIEAIVRKMITKVNGWGKGKEDERSKRRE